MRRIAITITISTAILLAACGSDNGSSDTSDATTTAASSPPSTEVGDTTTVDSPAATTTNAPTTVAQSFPDRPYDVFVPSTYDAATAAPLVILLHGYGASGAIQEFYFKLQPEAEARGFLYVHPDGTPNALGNLAWNATDACCHANVDDSAYLTAIISEVSATHNVDQSRIFLVGHSNGGFMSYRMACDHADRVAAIVSLAGATFLDTARCAPSEPVSVLQIHGTSDGTIKYGGGDTGLGVYPAANTTVATWSAYNGCAPATESLGTTDLAYNIDGVETTLEAFTDCPADGAVELWTIEGGPHIPGLDPDFAADIIDWLYAHPNA